MGRDGGILPPDDAESEVVHGLAVEGVFETAELVQDTPQRPDVRLGIVRFALAQLRGQVKGGAHTGRSHAQCIAQLFGDPEVTYQQNLAAASHTSNTRDGGR